MTHEEVEIWNKVYTEVFIQQVDRLDHSSMWKPTLDDKLFEATEVAMEMANAALRGYQRQFISAEQRQQDHEDAKSAYYEEQRIRILRELEERRAAHQLNKPVQGGEESDKVFAVRWAKWKEDEDI